MNDFIGVERLLALIATAVALRRLAVKPPSLRAASLPSASPLPTLWTLSPNEMTYPTVEPDGFSMVPGVLGPGDRRELLDVLGSVAGAGRRGLLTMPAVAEWARSSRLLDLVRPHLVRKSLPVRAIFFDKSPEANWLVSWHQDLTLALRSRAEVPGFGPWSVKDGVPHVQPPVGFLEQMLTVRLHLDDADEANGALRVLPGTHRLGRLSPAQIQELRAQQSDVLCTVAAGDALLMRPLLLHASGRSTSQRHRRVLHIEYAAFALPAGLHWHEGA